MASIRHTRCQAKIRHAAAGRRTFAGRLGVDDLSVFWQGLVFARENKALLLAREHKVQNANAVACELFGRDDLAGMPMAELIRDYPSPGGTLWESTLTVALPVPVEITRQHFQGGIDVFAIRDLRPRQEASRERELQSLALQQRDRELLAQRQIFETALRSMSQGLCVFDRDLRLVICNEAYLKVYDLASEEAQTGTHLRDILRYRIARGLYSGPSPDAFIEERLAVVASHAPVTVTHRFPDGRMVEVGHHPMPGGGWVATHRDVTDRRRLEAQLTEQNQRLKEHERRLEL